MHGRDRPTGRTSPKRRSRKPTTERNTMKHTTTALLFLAAAALCNAQEQGMITQSYNAMPGVEYRLSDIAGEVGTGRTPDDGDFIAIGEAALTGERNDFKGLFTSMGVPFPKGLMMFQSKLLFHWIPYTGFACDEDVQRMKAWVREKVEKVAVVR